MTLSYVVNLQLTPGANAKLFASAAPHYPQCLSVPVPPHPHCPRMGSLVPAGPLVFLTLRPAVLPGSVLTGYVTWASHLTAVGLSFPHL